MRRVTPWIPPVAWAGVIFLLSSMPSVPGPSYISYPAHFLEYAVLAALVVRALRRTARAGVTATVYIGLAAASAYGLTDEFHQLFVPGRRADPLDWLTDTAGALVAVLLARWWTLRRERGEAPG